MSTNTPTSNDVTSLEKCDPILEETSADKPNELDTKLPDIQVYKRRWIVLFLFSLLTCLQAGVWNQWGPIAAVSERVFGWTDGDIALFANWGPITFIPTALFWSWVLDTKGLRVSCVTIAALIAIGTGLRCITVETPAFTWMVHICQFLNGVAGPIAMGGVAKVSAVWFPPYERTTSTAIGYVFEGVGIGLTFLVGPLLVPENEYNDTNRTLNGSIGSTNESLLNEEWALDEQRRYIRIYMYGTFAICGSVFLAMLAYFPSQPPKPPSPSASLARLDYFTGLKQLFRKRRFWQLAFVYGISTGTRDAWSSMLDVNLKANGISQVEAGMLGVYLTLPTCVVGILFGRFADRFLNHLKLFLVVLNILYTLILLWLVLSVTQIIPESKASVYASSVLSGVSAGAISPLYYEMVCETAYPVSEGITNLSLTSMNNVAALVFLGILSAPNIGTAWMNWALLSAFAFAIIILVIVPAGHSRLDVDLLRDKPRNQELTIEADFGKD